MLAIGLQTAQFLCQVLFVVMVVGVAVVVVGMMPVNNDFEPTPNGVEVLFISDPLHAGIMVPIEHDVMDWREHFPVRCFAGDTAHATHVLFGWGDRAFCIETPTWADMKFSTTLRALFWPTDSSLRVSLLQPDDSPYQARAVSISADQYRRLTDYISASFLRDAAGQTFVQIPGAAHGRNDAFFESRDTYQAANNCNNWIGGAMKHCGIRTAWYTPLPKSMFAYLPQDR